MTFNCTDKDTLVAYVYGECDAATGGSVEAHLAVCPACAAEVAGFGMVRESLSQWAPPDRVGGFRLVRDGEEASAPAAGKVLRPARWWQAPLPALAKVAAAVLLVAGGAALANLEVRYDKDGFVVRTGWQKPAIVQVAAQVPRATPASQSIAAGTAADPAAFRAEFAALERQLRDEFRQQIAAVKAAAPAPAPVQVAGNVSVDENRLMQRVYTALEESERRQQVNVATYMSRLASDLQAGRAIDMRRIGFDTLPPALPPQTKPKSGMLFDVSLKK